MTKNILWIDDDQYMELNCLSIKLKLKTEKKIEHMLEFTIKDTPISAIETLKKSTFDTIICDGHLLFGTHGREVITFIKENQPDQLPKVIVHSSDALFVNECKEQGIKGCNKSSSSFDPIVNELYNVLNDKII